MPVMDGIEATQQIRDYLRIRDVPLAEQPIIIGITGHVEERFMVLGK